MRFLLRALLTVLAAIACSLPVFSAPGGGGGDSGIWILPNCLPISQSGNTWLLPPRAQFDLPVLSGGVTMSMPANMDAPMPVFYAVPTWQPLLAFTSGKNVLIPLRTLISIRDGTGSAAGVIVDANSMGFHVTVDRLGTQGLRICVY